MKKTLVMLLLVLTLVGVATVSASAKTYICGLVAKELTGNQDLWYGVAYRSIGEGLLGMEVDVRFLSQEGDLTGQLSPWVLLNTKLAKTVIYGGAAPVIIYNDQTFHIVTDAFYAKGGLQLNFGALGIFGQMAVLVGNNSQQETLPRGIEFGVALGF